MDSFKAAFELFMAESFEDACVSSTKAGWGGGSYSVELFGDGTYRVQDTGSIGNLYESPGIVLTIPQLGDDGWDEDNGHFFDDAEEKMREWFAESIYVGNEYANA